MSRSRRFYSVLLHFCIWGALILCSFLLAPRPMATREGTIGTISNLQIIGLILPFIGIFYLHAYWLIPAYLFRKKRVAYVLSVLMVISGAVLLSALIPYTAGHPPKPYLQGALRRIFPAVFFMLASASLSAFRQNFRLEKDRKEKETEHLRTELSFLRAQVNPHFMLNVLNSMTLLARKKSDLLEPALLELAGLMNYMLYEANNEKIRLENEIEYLRAYIDLQMLRFKDDVAVEFNTPQLVREAYIEPMLLIPLVENAFKHGIGLVENPIIIIDIRVEENNSLSVMVKNKYSHFIKQEEKTPPGIGLINLKKRLELIYPGEFRLTTAKNYQTNASLTENWFEIALNIPLE
jgi:two-component system LytT family sensor kinase